MLMDQSVKGSCGCSKQLQAQEPGLLRPSPHILGQVPPLSAVVSYVKGCVARQLSSTVQTTSF